MGGGGSKEKEKKEDCKCEGRKYSTNPRSIGKVCHTYQGERFCYDRYSVCDKKTECKDCKPQPPNHLTDKTLKCGVGPFTNNVIGIESNLHRDLEGSTLSLKQTSKKEPLREGLDAVAMDRMKAETDHAAAKARSEIDGKAKQVTSYGNQALNTISSKKGQIEREARGAITSANNARNNAAVSGTYTAQTKHSKDKTQYYENVADDKKNQTINHEHDAKVAEKVTRGDQKDVKKILNKTEDLLDKVKEDHNTTNNAAADAQATAEQTNLILNDVITERQKISGENVVGVLPGVQGDLGISSAQLSAKTRQNKVDGQKINNVLATLEEMGVGGDTFVPNRKVKKLEGFNIKEGLVGSSPTWQDIMRAGADVTDAINNQDLANKDQAKINATARAERSKHLAGELLHQRRNIAGEIYSDYLTSDKSTNLHDVYQRKKQDNIKKERLVQTKQYEMRVYDEYIKIGKIVVVAFVVFVLAKVLNNKGIMGDSLTELVIALIIIITIIYLIWKLVWLGLRDPINFDKTNQGYDRQYVKNMQGNKYAPKKYNLGFLTGTCSGNDCCSNGMEYDTARNKCIVQPDGFDNIVGTPINVEGFKSNKNAVVNEILGSI